MGFSMPTPRHEDGCAKGPVGMPPGCWYSFWRHTPWWYFHPGGQSGCRTAALYGGSTNPMREMFIFFIRKDLNFWKKVRSLDHRRIGTVTRQRAHTPARSHASATSVPFRTGFRLHHAKHHRTRAPNERTQGFRLRTVHGELSTQARSLHLI